MISMKNDIRECYFLVSMGIKGKQSGYENELFPITRRIFNK